MYSDEEDYDIERPSLIEIFYETGNQEVLKLYKQIMLVREQINVLVDDDYRTSNINKVK